MQVQHLTTLPYLKTDEKPVHKEDQVFLDELERLMRHANDAAEALKKEFAQETENLLIQAGAAKDSSTNIVNTVSTPAKASSTNIVNTVSTPVSTASPYDGLSLYDPTNPEQDDSEISTLEDIYQNPTDGIFNTSSYDDAGAVADFTNLETVVNVSPIPTSRINSFHPLALILGDPNSAVQTRSKVTKSSEAHAFVNYVQKQRRNNHKDFQHCLFACFLSQNEPKKILEALEDESWVDAMQEELMQFKIQKVWILVDLPYGKKAIRTKWVYRNKKDEKGVVVRNKARIEALGIFFTFASYMGFIVSNDVKRPSFMAKLMRGFSHFQSLRSKCCQENFLDSDYAGANLDRKSTTGGCQFLGRRLISWQCKKQTIVATSTTEAEYVAAASCCGQVLWIQNQMLDYGFNFMNTKIYIDNESTICIVKNPVYHSKTKHIAIRHHFIRDAYEKKLIQVLKIHTDDNVADLLTKAFDVSSSLGFRESLGRALDGTEALMLPKLFILWLATVSTDSAELVPMGKVSTAIETLKKNTAKALISLSPTITHSQIMAVLESCPKHNMVAYLEKTDGNAEFHEIIDFLTRTSIHHALTVSLVVSTTFVEQFWTTAKSKIINNVRHITAKVAGKPVSISEASIRSDLLFDDADGIDSLPNQAIFDAIQLMGYEGDLTVLTFNKALFSPQWRHLDAKKKFVMYPRSISIFLDKQLENVPVPLDHFPVNALTSKVFSFMVKKGKHFLGKVTPLFASMLVQPTEDEGAPSERPSEAQPTPSPPHPSKATVDPQSDPSPRPSPSTTILDSLPGSSGGNHGGQSSSDKSLSGNEGDMTLQSVYDLCISLCTQVSDQAKEIKHLNAQIKKLKKLKKQTKPVITHHKAWMKSISLKKRLAGKRSLKKNYLRNSGCLAKHPLGATIYQYHLLISGHLPLTLKFKLTGSEFYVDILVFDSTLTSELKTYTSVFKMYKCIFVLKLISVVFTEVFKKCDPESLMKLVCLSAIEETLFPVRKTADFPQIRVIQEL
ncbi:hypothetical protein Tco_0174602 [Tanacetum coccineum]